jgi:succinoglycan biosynthesis protein ExoA
MNNDLMETIDMAPAECVACPFVTIVVPTLNEEHYIEACLESLVEQWPSHACEILVVDGGSHDRTEEIVATFRVQHPIVRILHNPARIQSAAVNLAAQQAATEAAILVRADAHALYPPDFVKRCVAALQEHESTSVVVPMVTRANSTVATQHAIAAAQSSRLGNGGAAHRVGGASRYVDHGHHAAFDLAFFRGIGGYDERFTHNEDAELDVRAAKFGGRIWMCTEAPVIYYPRDRFDRLAQQYYRHGRGRAYTLQKHRMKPKPRQMIPVFALIGCAGGVMIAPILPDIAVLSLCYPLLCLSWGLTQMFARRDRRLATSGVALMAIHLSWAIGFIVGAAQSRRSTMRWGLHTQATSAPLLVSKQGNR